jgi:hypothetical protein
MVKSRTIQRRPDILLEESDHPLSLEQHEGITEERLLQIVDRCMHG